MLKILRDSAKKASDDKVLFKCAMYYLTHHRLVNLVLE